MQLKIGKKYLLTNGYNNQSWITIVGTDIHRTKYFGVTSLGFFHTFNSVGTEYEGNRFKESLSIDLNTENSPDWRIISTAKTEEITRKYGINFNVIIDQCSGNII